MSQPELQPQIFIPKSDEKLPAYIAKTEQGVLVTEQVIEGNPGPYAMIADFGHSLEPLRQKTAMQYQPQGVEVLSATNDTIKAAIYNITLLANCGVSWDDQDLSILYTANYALIMKEMLSEILDDSYQDNNFTLLTLLRGGKVYQVAVDALGYKPHVPQIRAGRVLLADGSYLIGIKGENGPLGEFRDKILFLDDCIAAAGSTHTALKAALLQNPVIKTVTIGVGVGVKRSSEALARVWSKNGVGFKAFLAGTCNAMNDHYYLLITPEEIEAGLFPPGTTMGVGDMGTLMNLSHSGKERVLDPLIRAIMTEKIDNQTVLAQTTRFLNQELEIDRASAIIRNT